MSASSSAEQQPLPGLRSPTMTNPHSLPCLGQPREDWTTTSFQFKYFNKLKGSLSSPSQRSAPGPRRSLRGEAEAEADLVPVGGRSQAGFLFSIRAGTGLVIARLADGSWSAPSAIGTAGVGAGLMAGAEMAEFLIILKLVWQTGQAPPELART